MNWVARILHHSAFISTCYFYSSVIDWLADLATQLCTIKSIETEHRDRTCTARWGGVSEVFIETPLFFARIFGLSTFLVLWSLKLQSSRADRPLIFVHAVVIFNVSMFSTAWLTRFPPSMCNYVGVTTLKMGVASKLGVRLCSGIPLSMILDPPLSTLNAGKLSS